MAHGWQAGLHVVIADCRFQHCQRARALRRINIGEHEGGTQPVEQIALMKAAADRVDPAHRASGCTGCGELPAGFVSQQHLLALEQRAYPARHHAILRDQRNGALAGVKPESHLVYRCPRFCLQRRRTQHAHPFEQRALSRGKAGGA